MGDLPTDRDIPALAALADRALGPVLAGMGLPGPIDEVAVLKYHPGSRCTFRARVDDRRVVLKAYTKDPSPLVHLLERLQAESLASARPPIASSLVAYDRALRLVATEWFDAPSAGTLIARGTGAQAGGLAASWLRAATGVALDLGELYTSPQVIRAAARHTRTVSRADRRLGSQAAALAEGLAIDPPREPRLGLRHGTFTVNHLFSLPDGPRVIDVDRFCQAAPELDAAFFLATLRRFAGRYPRHARAADDAAQTFSAGVADLVDQATLAWYRSAMLVRLAAHLASQRSWHWRLRVRTLLDEAQAALDREPAGETAAPEAS